MILRLRQRHRVIIVGLSVALPLLLSAAVARRRAVPRLAVEQARIIAPMEPFDKLVWSKRNLWPGKSWETALRANPAGSLALEFKLPELLGPDVLVYWVQGTPRTESELPGTAVLLGKLLNETPLPLLDSQSNTRGQLLLYSLADHKVLARSGSIVLHTAQTP